MQSYASRRQGSTTSLAQYERAPSPTLQDASLDFCNSFWGVGDGGVDVLFARMRGATRTVEELRNFWKERAVIEEDYAKRLAKLSKVALGRDEIGDLRVSLETVKTETERQAGYHATLAHSIRNELEAPTTAFLNRQISFKKSQQTNIEKEFKTKQAQEAHVIKSRDKYEADGVRINSYSAQSSLVQGKELEKIRLKLERAQQTVQVNEREFANFTKILADTTQKWELSWKAFCDNCQDLEEQRIEFMKDNVWNYANAVSTVCVSDDESCEKIRLALEQTEPEREMENFVANYGTGNHIPDPPPFVNYNSPDAIPSSSQRVTTRPANFERVSTREIPYHTPEPPVDNGPQINAAGIGAGGASVRGSGVPSDAPSPRQDSSRRVSVAASSAPSQPYINGTSSSGPSISPAPIAPNQRQLNGPQPSTTTPHDPHAEPIDPNAETYIKVGSHAYKVDLSNDPQQAQQGRGSTANTASPIKPVLNGEVDPLQQQLESLQNVVSATGSTRRNTLYKGVQQHDPSRTSASVASSSRQSNASALQSLVPPGSSGAQINRSPSPNRDYRQSADMIVGPPPGANDRPASPNPPTAAFMLPKSNAPPGSEKIDEVLADYQQSLPGEKKSISRNNSRGRRISTQAQQSLGHASGGSVSMSNANSNLMHGASLQRPGSGHAGIGAHGGSRSNSPQPPVSRGPSPAPNAPRHNFIQAPAQTIGRAASPNSIGIALDPNGRVMHDDMAQGYQPQHQQQPQQVMRQSVQQRPPQQQGYAQPMQQQQPQQRRLSYMATPSPTIAAPPPQIAQSRTPPPPAASMYQQPTQAASTYAAPPAAHPTYTSPSQLLYQQQQQTQTQTQPVHQPPVHQQQHYQAPPPAQQQSAAYAQTPRNASVGSGFPYSTQPQQQQAPPPPVQQQQQYHQAAQGYQQQPQQQAWNAPPAPVAVRRSPSPQPPPQQMANPTTEDGTPIQFYVKALYDYAATIDEEFDFQAGDIIAVTSTPEDGWWTGELLDEARRQRGRNVFPSNFVCLF